MRVNEGQIHEKTEKKRRQGRINKDDFSKVFK